MKLGMMCPQKCITQIISICSTNFANSCDIPVYIVTIVVKIWTFVTYQKSEQQYTHTGFAENVVQNTMQVFNLVGVAWDDTVHCENSLDPSSYEDRRGEFTGKHCAHSTFSVAARCARR
jgi:hypothetical protein